jgi:ubiquinone/menaquinone biosynthesis C-methylase UbiE
MRINNPKVLEDLANKVPLKLNLGAGTSPRDGFYSVDRIDAPSVDIVADLNQPLDLLPDNCVRDLYSQHALEHIDRVIPLLKEIHRLTLPEGSIEIVVPHFTNPYGYSDPTHVHFFGLYSMYYFVDPRDQPQRKVPAFYSDVRFHVTSIRIEFYRRSLLDRLVGPALARLVNRSIAWQDWYERRLSPFFHASQIRYVMQPAK